jgi:hypothetical protein
LLSRRSWLLLATATVASACTRPQPRVVPLEPPTPPELGPFQQEAREILSDALQTLRGFEVFGAFRVSSAESSGRRGTTDLSWDPPARGAWDEAIHVTQGLAARAEQLFNHITQAQVDRAAWREQRRMAERTSGLIELGQALAAYREAINGLSPASDGTQLWDMLDRLWERWNANAAEWGVDRAESVACAT